MRIANLSRSPIPSMEANAVSVMNTCQALADEGHEVVLFAREGPLARADVDPFTFYGVAGGFELALMPHGHAGRVRGIRYGWDVVGRMQRMGRFDFVIGRDIHSVALAARRQTAPVVYESHRPPHRFPADAPHRWLYRAKTFAGVAAQSMALTTWYQQTHPSFADSVAWTPNGAWPVLEEPPRPPQWPGRRGHTQAGYVGTIAEGKGVELILDIAARAPDVDFHIVGGPSGGTRIDLRIDERLTNVYLHGFVEPARIGSYLAALDCLLVTQQAHVTLGYGTDLGRWLFPLKIYEGMAHGVAMCVSDLPVMQEVLTDGVDAVFAAADDADAWARAIDGLARDAPRRHALGQNARRLLESEFTWAHRARRIVAMSQSVVT